MTRSPARTERVRSFGPPAHLADLARNGRAGLLVGLAVTAIIAAATLPALLAEGTRDWTIYQHASERLAAGQPLYLFQQSAAREAYFLYPPFMAAIWPWLGGPVGLVALKLVSILGVAALATLPTEPMTTAERVIVGAALALAALIVVPDIHDFVLGNVMVLYVGAVSWSVVRKGWLGAIPLGAIIAAAVKPAIVPYLIWLLVRRPADAARVIGTAAVLSAVTALVIGPGQYVEYLRALPAMSVLLKLEGGNAGLAVFGTAFAIAGMLAGFSVSVWAASRLEPVRGAAIAIAASLLVQPTLGLNYGGLLLPAAVCLWTADRVTGFVSFLVLPALVIVSPPLAAAILIVLALARPLAARRAAGAPA